MLSPSVFLSYAHKNKALARALAEALARHKVEGLWWDRELSAGAPWRPEVETALSHANIVLLLMTGSSASRHAANSGYMWTHEFRRANERRVAGERVRIVPVMAEDVGAWLEQNPETRLLELERLLKDERYYSDGPDDWLDEVASEVATLVATVRGSNETPPIEVDMQRRKGVADARATLQRQAAKASPNARLVRILGDLDALLNGIAVDRAHHSIPRVLNALYEVRYEERDNDTLRGAINAQCEALDFWLRAHGDERGPEEAAQLRFSRAANLQSAAQCEAELDKILRSVGALRDETPAAVLIGFMKDSSVADLRPGAFLNSSATSEMPVGLGRDARGLWRTNVCLRCTDLRACLRFWRRLEPALCRCSLPNGIGAADGVDYACARAIILDPGDDFAVLGHHGRW